MKKLLVFQVTHLYSFLQHNNGRVGPDSRLQMGGEAKYFADVKKTKNGRAGKEPGLLSALMNTHQNELF